MEKRIQVTKDVRQYLAKAYRCTDRTVYNSLGYKVESRQARMIRHTARMMGGWMVISNPCAETLFDGDDMIRQYFGNGAVLELSKKDGSGRVCFRGKTMRNYSMIHLSEIDSIQSYACSLR